MTNPTPAPEAQANTVRRYEVRAHELPLSCPMTHMRVWDSHPKVYLPIEQSGHEVCPYCSTEYVLVEGT